MLLHVVWLALLGLLALAPSALSADEASSPAIYPGAGWDTKAPAAVGLDADRLRAMADYTGGFGCVVRGGCLVYTWGPVDRRVDVASACKPWFAHFLFRAIEDGKIKSLDEPLVGIEPGLAELNAALGYKDREIAWRHLASQTSCYGVEERPGKAYDYSDYNMALFYDNLFLKVYGVTHAHALRPRSCADSSPTCSSARMRRSSTTAGGWLLRRATSPVSVCSICAAATGGGNNCSAAEHVRTLLTSPLSNEIPRTAGKPAEMLPQQRSIGGGSNQTDHLGSYSFTWWLNGVDRHGKRHWPDAPQDTFAALGHNSKRAMVVLPSHDLIVAWNESKVEGAEMANRALQLLLSAAGD